MFAIEIGFEDDVSQPETIFVRRPHALIGSSDAAHVVVEDMAQLGFEIRLIRDLGRRFRCEVVKTRSDVTATDIGGGSFENEASLDLGPVKMKLIALDLDLLVREGEPTDRASVRVARLAASSPGPRFPAVVVKEPVPIIVSFSVDQPLDIGRSKQCGLRLDSPTISSQHSRIGYEAGEFWVEDLGSTNGTFIDQQQISGRVTLKPGSELLLGHEISLHAVINEEQLQALVKDNIVLERKTPTLQRSAYPALVSVSEVARPARVLVSPGTVFKIGRDPTSDMWLGAPHVSRMHCTVDCLDNGHLIVRDHSTNGTAYDGGILRRGDELSMSEDPKVLDFGGGVTVAICFSDAHEKLFVNSGGSPHVFARGDKDGASQGGRRKTSSLHLRSELQNIGIGAESGDRVDVGGFVTGVLRLYFSLGKWQRKLLILSMVGVVSLFALLIIMLVPLFKG